jgi:hypothetical protein
MYKFLSKIMVISICTGAFMGGYETHTQTNTRIFSNKPDSFQTGITRGSIRGVFIPLTIMYNMPNVLQQEIGK